MPRPKSKPAEVRSRTLHVRLRDQEWAGLQHLAVTLDQRPSRIMRRLLREALTGGPDYFKDDRPALSRVSRELAAIGRNLNQLTRAANQGQAVSGDEVQRVVNAARVQTAAVKALYDQVLDATVKRAVVPLYEEAALPRPAAGKG